MGLILTSFRLKTCLFHQQQKLQCIHHGLTFLLLCVPVIFADAKVLIHNSMKNSTRSVFAINPVATKNMGNGHDTFGMIDSHMEAASSVTL